eukprot:s209_g14.t1
MDPAFLDKACDDSYSMDVSAKLAVDAADGSTGDSFASSNSPLRDLLDFSKDGISDEAGDFAHDASL